MEEKYDVRNGMNRVEEIIEEISKPDTDLEKTTELYAEATIIIKNINEEIKKVEQEMKLKIEEINNK